MSTPNLLRRALTLLDNGKAWTTGVSARTHNNSRVLSTSLWAVRWCPRGAVESAAHDEGVDPEPALDALRDLVPGGWLNGWNDHADRVWADVDALFLRAIEQAESRAA